jgi:hypothetical protein
VLKLTPTLHNIIVKVLNSKSCRSNPIICEKIGIAIPATVYAFTVFPGKPFAFVPGRILFISGKIAGTA